MNVGLLTPAFSLAPVWDQKGKAVYSLIDNANGLFEPSGIWATVPLGPRWVQPILVVATKRKSADIYFCPSHLWLFSKDARQALSWTEDQSAEFLPVTIAEIGTYYLLHALVAVALASSATVHRNEISGNISIEDAAFESKDVGDTPIFYAAQPLGSAAGRAGLCCPPVFLNSRAAADLRVAAISGATLVPTKTW
jgi:hypothetical protein